MKNTVKLLGSVTIVAALAACTGTTVPGATGPGTVGKPGFSGRITKNNQPVAGRVVFLKAYSGAKEGEFGTNTNKTDLQTKTKDDGTFFLEVPADAVSGGGMYGLAYDAANKAAGGDEKKAAATENKDEIQWFYTPAIDLKSKVGNTQSINFDIGWDTNAFKPTNGAVVAAPKVEFSFPEKTGATQYEVMVFNGLTTSGTKAFNEKGDKPAFTWTAATPGDYTYTAKFNTGTGVGGVQSSSSALTFKVEAAKQ